MAAGAARRKLASESDSAAKPFTVFTNTGVDLTTLQGDVAKWRKPSLTILKGTVLGDADFASYLSTPEERRARQNGSFVPVPPEQWRRWHMEDQFDALLYVGAPFELTTAKLSSKLCADKNYVNMRVARFALAGIPPAFAERFRQLCVRRASSEPQSLEPTAR